MGRICGFSGITDKSLLKKMCNTMSQKEDRCDYFISDTISLCSKVSNDETQLAGNEDRNFWIIV